MLLRQQVHARAGGEVVGRLGAAVQHHHQRQGLPVEAARARTACRRGCRPGWRRIRPGTWRPPAGRSGVGVASPLSPSGPGPGPLAWKRSTWRARRRKRSIGGASGMAAWAGGAIPPPGQGPMPVTAAFGDCRRGAVTSTVSGVRSRTPALVERRRDGSGGEVARLAAQQALQQRGGFAEPAGLDEAGGGQQVGAAWGLVHGKHPGWRRARVGVASLTGLPRRGVEKTGRVAAARAARITRCGRPGRP